MPAKLTATYLFKNLDYADGRKKVERFAFGQSIGTWIDVPGMENVDLEYGARLLDFYSVSEEGDSYVARISFNTGNFGGSIAQLLVALKGNDVSTSLQTTLLDIEFEGGSFFTGPVNGIEGFRKAVDVYGRPVIMNMIKPCAGYTAEQGSRFYSQAASSGVDLVKDDEIFGDTDYCSVRDRIRLYTKEYERLKNETEKPAVYCPNVTSTSKKIRENLQCASDYGIRAVLMNFVFTGFDFTRELIEEFSDKICFLFHYAGIDMVTGGGESVREPVVLGKLARYIGADSSMIMYRRGNNFQYSQYLKSLVDLTEPSGCMLPCLPSVGGGITPAEIENIYRDTGPDVLLAVGGAVQGHPNGIKAGAGALKDAVTAAVNNIPVEEAAENNSNLKTALDLWPEKK